MSISRNFTRNKLVVQNNVAMTTCHFIAFNRMCTHQTNIKRNGKITDFDATWAG